MHDTAYPASNISRGEGIPQLEAVTHIPTESAIGGHSDSHLAGDNDILAALRTSSRSMQDCAIA